MKHLGMTGMAGLAMLVLAVVVYAGMILPNASKLDRLTEEMAAAQQRQKVSIINPAQDTHSTAGRLRTFYEFFPSRENEPKVLGKIYKAARDESVRLAEGEYKYSLGKAGRMGMYQVNLPVKGSYVQLRKFIVKVLNTLPNASLEQISFKRETIGSAEIEANIRFTIYLRDA
jgi:hypothetical protein